MTFNTSDLMMICVLYGIAISAAVIVIGSMPKKSRLVSENNEWLIDNFWRKLYNAVFGNTDPVKIIKAFGLEYDKYMFYCSLLGKTPDFETEAMMRVIGTFSFFFGLIFAVILYSPFPMVLGIAVYLLLCSYPVRKTHSQAEQRKLRMANEMPRFVDLLLAALEINLPIEIAIKKTADAVPCVLSDELKTTFAETEIGAKNWQQALESIAQKYEVDQLSDFVLNIITAFNKGVSVTDAVAREAFAVRQSLLLSAKERTAKMTSIILVPLVVFKILPLMVILMYPLMLQAQTL